MACDKLKDAKYDKWDKYEHVYCRTCGHSIFFLRNRPVDCSFCGTMVYPSKKSEFKQKLERELRKSKYREEL
jgi:ribosomal protein L37E